MQGWALLLRWGLLQKHNTTFPEQQCRTSSSTGKQLSDGERSRGARTTAVGVSDAFPGTLHWWASSHCRRPQRCTSGAAEGPPCGPCGGTAGDPEGGNATGKAPAPPSPGRWWGGELLTGSHVASYFTSVPFTKPNQQPPWAGPEEGAGPTTAGHPGIRCRDPRKGPQDTPGLNRSEHEMVAVVTMETPSLRPGCHEGTESREGPPWLRGEGEAKRPYKF